MYKLQKNWADVILVLCLVLAFSFTMLEAHTQCIIDTNPCSSSSGGYDPFGCSSGGNPTQAAQNYINQYCPGVFTLSSSGQPPPQIPPPTVQYVTSISSGNPCGFTDCMAGTIKIRSCDLCSSTSPFPCPDICHTAAHEFAHWVYCNTSGAPAQTTCQFLYTEIGAERYAYDYCLSMPYQTDPYCVTVRKFLKTACTNYTLNLCSSDPSLTTKQKADVTEWCTLCTCVMMLPPGSKFCNNDEEADPPLSQIYLCTGKDVDKNGACDLELLEDCGMMNPPKTCTYDTMTNCPLCI